MNFDKFKTNTTGIIAILILGLSYALKKSDSCLASAMTEIRIMQTMKKL